LAAPLDDRLFSRTLYRVGHRRGESFTLKNTTSNAVIPSSIKPPPENSWHNGARPYRLLTSKPTLHTHFPSISEPKTLKISSPAPSAHSIPKSAPQSKFLSANEINFETHLS
jgi:hypothetical protein